MNLKLAICKKEGARNYGSNGASAEVSIDLDPDFSIEMVGPGLHALAPGPDRRGGRSACQYAAGAGSPSSNRNPDTSHGGSEEGNRSDPAGPTDRPEPPAERRRTVAGAVPTASRTGVARLGPQARAGRGRLQLGKSWKLPDRVIDWDPQHVRSLRHPERRKRTVLRRERGRA